MAKVLDGGISTGPLETLIDKIEFLQLALGRLLRAVVFEEHTSSLISQIDDAKCAEITRARKAVENSIDSPPHAHGIVKSLSDCSSAVDGFTQDVTRLKAIFDPLASEPTGAPGHC